MTINWGKILGMALALIPQAVHGVESLIGESQSGASKQQMATDALNDALTGALTVTTGGNAQLAQVAAGGVLAGINITAQIAKAVTDGKAAGTYQAATAQGNALQAQLSTLSTSNALAAAPATGSAAAPAGTTLVVEPSSATDLKLADAEAEPEVFTPAENAE